MENFKSFLTILIDNSRQFFNVSLPQKLQLTFLPNQAIFGFFCFVGAQAPQAFYLKAPKICAQFQALSVVFLCCFQHSSPSGLSMTSRHQNFKRYWAVEFSAFGASCFGTLTQNIFSTFFATLRKANLSQICGKISAIFKRYVT